MSQSKGLPRIGLVGFGYWGPNLLRNLIAHGGAQAVGVIDPSPDARARVQKLYPHLPVYADLAQFLKEVGPDAMIVATPPWTHQDVAVACLRAGAHVLVEKPLAMSSAECEVILAEAFKAGKRVMVDHTFAFHPAVEYLDQEAKKGTFGNLLYFDSVRVNLGGFQPRTNALWDLAPHDLSILDMLLGGQLPLTLSATGVRHFGTSVENLCYLHLNYKDNFIAHLHLNWVAPIKIRTVMLGGTKKMAVYDENLPSEKIKVYDKSVSIAATGTGATAAANGVTDFRASYRTGDMTAPAISGREALAGMMAGFIGMVAGGAAAVSDGVAGARVVKVLEAATRSMESGGVLVEVAAPTAAPKRGKSSVA